MISIIDRSVFRGPLCKHLPYFGLGAVNHKSTYLFKKFLDGLLVLTIALYWVASTSMQLRQALIKSKKAQRSLTSFFKRGLRFILHAALTLSHIPTLWAFLKFVRC